MKNRPHIVRFALALMLTCLLSVAAYAAPGTITLPDFSKPVLDGATQPSFATFDNIIPNALADYFTYVPYTTADAVALGFPATCGNVAKGDTASTEDCYTITVKSFQQALSLQGIFGGGPGLVGLDGVTPLSTKAFGYGSGGPGWVLPYYDTTKPGVVPNTPVTGNAPAGPLAGGIWHFPAPTIKGAFGRPIRVQWLNELPNEAPVGLDPSVDCGPNAPNCFPYNRITTHVHGAHVGPESDGLASAWFTPNFAVVGEDFVSTRQFGPEGTYFYPMDQEASTIWYHDHAMGTTHNNTNMGMAGFFPITDPNEQSLIATNVLPTGAYELGFALQDRHFDAATGNMVMPDYPIYDLTSPGCTVDPVTGLADALNCPNGLVKWMKAKDPNNPADTVGHFVPYNAADTATLNNGLNAGAPFGAPSATLEYFGNIPVVNGVVYGKYNVEPRVYRMRFIGGTDSRTWVMKLQYTDAAGVVQTVPFWQIGTEQGLLNNPILRTDIDLMPGERVDVLVDFNGIPAGTRVLMKNLGPDTPWPGAFEYQAGLVAPSVDIPEIMAFDVTAMPAGVVDTIIPPAATTPLRSIANNLSTDVLPVYSNNTVANPPVLPAINNTRVVSLMEITDGYGRTMPTIDARGFKPVGIPVTEIVKLNNIEQWDIVNTTVDAHPMHLHQVAFKVISREALATALDPVTGLPVFQFTPPTDNILTQVFTPPSYAAAGGPIYPDAWDDGWKDTVATPPGYVTRVWAKFDIPGEYVWHCHILSHEEHDMMRNFIVTDAVFAAPAPASITVPKTSTTGTYSVNWVGTAIPGVTYELQEATDSLFVTATTVQNTTAPSFTTLPKTVNGSFYYRVRAIPPAASGFTTGIWRTAANPTVVQLPLAITAAALPASAVNAPYSNIPVNAVNGVAPLTWTATGLPASMTINPATGAISGTPAPADILAGTASSYAITVTVTDSAAPAASLSAPLTLVINQVLPAAPSALTASLVTPASVNLTWTDNSNNETGFTVTRTPAFPAGFVNSVAAGVVTFTDTTAAAGTAYSYSVVATNALGSSAASTISVAVPAVLVISTATLPAGTINAAYSGTVTATGGTPPYNSFGATGLPSGLAISATGVISGTPTATGTYAVTINVIDAVGVMATAATNITINPEPLVIAAVTAPAGVINTPYSVTVTATGGTGTHSFSATGLPAGLTISAAGVISGTPTAAGTSAVTVTVTDAAAVQATSAVSITINPAALVLIPITAPAGTANIAYSLSVTATGGTTPYTFSATGLPAGITIAPATGLISGTPTVAGTYAVSVTVTDAALKTATAATSIVIGAPVALALPAVVAPAGHINIAYTLTMAAIGGSTPYTYAATGLPAGVKIAPATGVISGIPTVAGTFAVTVTVTDKVLNKATTRVSIVINPDPLAITAVVAPVGTVNVSYTLALATTGGLPPVKWAASGLPAGLTISNAGVISGTTKTAGTYAVTVIAIDATAMTATAAFNITINGTAAALSIPSIVAPAATLNVPYTLTVTATGGTAPYTFTATGLPVGLVISPAGVISGIPTKVITVATIYTVTVKATDALLAAATRKISITVNPTAVVTAPLALPTAVVAPVGTVNKSYKLTVKATGGTAPYVYSAAGLPAGLSISNTGAISGIIAPTAVPTGLSAIIVATVTVADSAGATASLAISITVNQVVPKAPTGLFAAAGAVPVGTPATAAVRTVALGWIDNSNNETGFVLERSTTQKFAVATTVLVPLAANAITYTDTMLLAKTKYFYRVKATNGAGVSAYSPIVTVTTK